MRLKQLVITAIGILIVGTGLLLSQRIYNSPSTVEQAGPTGYSSTDEPNQVGRESTSAIEPGSNVTSSIHPELTSMPLVTEASNELPGVASATGTSLNDLIITIPGPAISTSDLTEGLIGNLSTPTGRLAPDVLVDALQFSNIRIYKNNDLGVFSVQANMKNLGAKFLNQLVLSWKILDGAGQILDQGQFTWPNLAPNETATITFDGTEVFSDTWSRIEFTYVQG